MQIMTKNHRRWSEFIETLRLLMNYKGLDENAHPKNCDCDPSMPETCAVLADMGFSLIEMYATLDYLKADGAFSDCTVLAYEDKGAWPTSI